MFVYWEMSFTVGSIGAALWIVGGQIELKTHPARSSSYVQVM